MYRLIVYREPLSTGDDFMQDMQRFDVRLISYGWRNQFNWMPLLSIDETDEEIYLYWEFPNDEEALLFKLTHM